jgi:ABC-type antimicrobial peptide transport system permease subunit
MLFEVSERDPLTISAIALTLTLVGILASAVPAVRATRLDPLDALRID